MAASGFFFPPQLLCDPVQPRSQHGALPGLHLGLGQELQLQLTIGWLHLTIGSGRDEWRWSGLEASSALKGEGRGERAEAWGVLEVYWTSHSGYGKCKHTGEPSPDFRKELKCGS